jgi:hypothetical protein
MTIGVSFTDFFDAMQARDIARGGGAPMGIILREINYLKEQIDTVVSSSGLSVTVGIGGYSVAAATNISGGAGYSVNDILTILGGSGAPLAQITVNAVAEGFITSYSVSQIGSYTIRPPDPVAVSGGTGINAIFDITWNTIGAGSPMTADTNYYYAWSDPVTYSQDLFVLNRSRMDAVLRYFSTLGYRVQRQRVLTTDFFQWVISF